MRRLLVKTLKATIGKFKMAEQKVPKFVCSTILCIIALSFIFLAEPVSSVEKAAGPLLHSRAYTRRRPTQQYPNYFSCDSEEVPDARPPPHERLFNSSTVERVIEDVGKMINDDMIRQIFANCLPSTLDTTVLYHVNATQSPRGIPYTYIITGDIPAMWLRDSTYQINPYVPLAAADPKLQQMVLGVINTQAEMINLYPYGNAFLPLKHWNSGIIVDPPEASASDDVHPEYDRTEVFEAKYELDSLASFLYLTKYYHESTRDLSFINNPAWLRAVNATLQTMRKLQGGTIEVFGREPYKFTRMTRTQSETQNLYGLGNPVKRCGLVRSFFRPSDDATIFHYLIPANALAVVGLEGTADALMTAGVQPQLMEQLYALASEIRQGIEQWGIVNHPEFGRVYAYEVDCYGSHVFMDDANFPSVLSMAKFGYVPKNDPIYLNSRKYILNPQWNPYFAAGRYPGVGSPHTGLQKPWHMAVAMQAMTSDDEVEIMQMLMTLRNTTAGTGFMHESYDVSNPCSFTRSWFAWANTVFGDLILHLAEERPHLLAGEAPRRPRTRRNKKYRGSLH